MMAKRGAEAMADATHLKRARVDESAEVAGDFQDSLSDLVSNDRYQISTLTIIAKENTEYARAISDVLRKHIRTVPPTRKLPALYVLDSIVKNVGTPYTLFLAQDLYQTFFDAYTVVDDATRRQMESMLKTWREPAPGSLDGKAVFPVDATRRIETALIRARTAFIEQQKNQSPHLLLAQRNAVNAPSHAPAPQFAGAGHHPSAIITPMMQSTHVPPYLQGYQQQQQQQQPYVQQSSNTPVPDFQYGLPPPGNGVVNGGYQNSQIPRGSGYIQDSYQLPQQLRSPPPPPSYQSMYQPPPLHSGTPQPGLGYPPPQGPPYLGASPAPQNHNPYMPPHLSNEAPHLAAPPPPPPNLSILLQLTGQLPASQAQQQHQPPQYTSSTAQPAQQQYQNHRPPPPPPPPQLDLAELLKLTQHATTPSQHYNGFVPPPSLAPSTVIPSLSAINKTYPTPPIVPALLPQASATQTVPKNNVALTSASLKIPRPHLVRSLFPGPRAGTQCTTCGRRFAASASASTMTTASTANPRKARHLDAHFRTNMRLAALAGGDGRAPAVQRSWYLDERAWIAFREPDDADDDGEAAVGEGGGRRAAADDAPPLGGALGGETAGASTARGTVKGAASSRYMAAPADAALRRAPCPICREAFETAWSDAAQEWVWPDAVEADSGDGDGRRVVYHASCLELLAGDAR